MEAPAAPERRRPAAPVSSRDRAAASLRPAPQSVVPDLVLALAVGAITLAPATYGLSAVLAPAAWIASEVQIRRRRARGERIGERLYSARACGALVTCVVGGPIAVGGVIYLVFALVRGL